MKFIDKNIQYPKDLKAKGIEGKVYVKFVVKADSTIENIVITKSSEREAFDKEAIRVISTMPKWRPGSQMGTPVNVYFTLPVNFSLSKR